MAYSTGNYTNIADALAQVVAWAVTNGWTDNSGSIASGTQIYKNLEGTIRYFNFDSSTSSTFFGFGYDNTTGIAIAASTGTDSSAWNTQPGIVEHSPPSSTDPWGGCVDDMVVAGGVYHFFATTNSISAMFETSVGDWRGFTFGSAGGSMYYFSSGGSENGSSGTEGVFRSSMFTCHSNTDGGSAVFDGAFWCVCNSFDPRSSDYKLCSQMHSGTFVFPAVDVFGSLAAAIVEFTPDQFRGNTVLAPAHINVSQTANNRFYTLGVPEGVKLLNMKNMASATTITVDGDDYIVFKQNEAYDRGYSFLK